VSSVRFVIIIHGLGHPGLRMEAIIEFPKYDICRFISCNFLWWFTMYDAYTCTL